jgi:hypothetical protein
MSIIAILRPLEPVPSSRVVPTDLRNSANHFPEARFWIVSGWPTSTNSAAGLTVANPIGPKTLAQEQVDLGLSDVRTSTHRRNREHLFIGPSRAFLSRIARLENCLVPHNHTCHECGVVRRPESVGQPASRIGPKQRSSPLSYSAVG